MRTPLTSAFCWRRTAPVMPRTARMRGTNATRTLKAMAPARKKMLSSPAF